MCVNKITQPQVKLVPGYRFSIHKYIHVCMQETESLEQEVHTIENKQWYVFLDHDSCINKIIYIYGTDISSINKTPCNTSYLTVHQIKQ